MRRNRGKAQFSPLPASCGDCKPFGGLWRRSESGGMERCGCARGRAIYDRSPAGRRAAKKAAREARRAERIPGHDGRLAGAGGDE